VKPRVMRVPADLRKEIEEAAADMGVPPEWVLRACVRLGLREEDDPMNDLVSAVQDIRDDPKRVIRMPRYHRKKRSDR